jgi:hypothetical protein
MKSDIRWNEIAKIEMRPGAPARPAEAVKAISRHAPTPKKQRPPSKGRVRKGKSRS